MNVLVFHRPRGSTMDRNDDQVPLDKLLKNLELSSNHDDQRTKIVLLSTGAYCPVHKMHIEIFNKAKEHLEKEHGFNVVAGFISPTHDSYVNSKLSRSQVSSINSHHRLEMVSLMVKDSTWISASSWESKQPHFEDFPSVYQFLVQFLQHNVPQVTLRVMYLCGADHALRCNLHRARSMYTVAIARPGTPVNRAAKSTSIIFVENETEDFSSTQVREFMLAGKDITEFTSPEIVEYIKRNNITVQKLR